MLLGGQLLIVFGAHREGMHRAGLFAALATPFIILIKSVFFPDDSDDVLAHFQFAVSQGEWKSASSPDAGIRDPDPVAYRQVAPDRRPAWPRLGACHSFTKYAR